MNNFLRSRQWQCALLNVGVVVCGILFLLVGELSVILIWPDRSDTKALTWDLIDVVWSIGIGWVLIAKRLWIINKVQQIKAKVEQR